MSTQLDRNQVQATWEGYRSIFGSGLPHICICLSDLLRGLFESEGPSYASSATPANSCYFWENDLHQKETVVKQKMCMYLLSQLGCKPALGVMNVLLQKLRRKSFTPSMPTSVLPVQ